VVGDGGTGSLRRHAVESFDRTLYRYVSTADIAASPEPTRHTAKPCAVYPRRGRAVPSLTLRAGRAPADLALPVVRPTPSSRRSTFAGARRAAPRRTAS
jgi:hypothetical protein